MLAHWSVELHSWVSGYWALSFPELVLGHCCGAITDTVAVEPGCPRAGAGLMVGKLGLDMAVCGAAVVLELVSARW